MTWLDLLKRLDELRVRVRITEDFQQRPRAVVPQDVATWFDELASDVAKEEGPSAIVLETDENGRPIIPLELQGLFATVPSPADPQKSAGVTRRNPVMGKAAPAAASETRAVPMPRTTPRIEHPLSLDDADEGSVAK